VEPPGPDSLGVRPRASWSQYRRATRFLSLPVTNRNGDVRVVDVPGDARIRTINGDIRMRPL